MITNVEKDVEKFKPSSIAGRNGKKVQFFFGFWRYLKLNTGAVHTRQALYH